MEITGTIKDIILSVSGRSSKYKELCISRYEYKKYWVTEYEMRKMINFLKKDYLQLVRCEKYTEKWAPRRRNIYIATQKLLDLVKSLTKSITDMNAKIIDWCKQNPVQKLRDMGVFVACNGRIWDKKYKTTVNKRNWAITNWKTKESWNIFNYLRDKENCTTLYFFNHFIWS